MGRQNWLLGLIFAVCVGCNKTADFMYAVPPSAHITTQFKIKELVGNSQLDMLWLIDNSASMSSHQQNVILNTDRFMRALMKGGNLNWKAGLISTDIRDQPYIGFDPTQPLNSTMPLAADFFKSAVQRLGLNGDGRERMYEPIIQVLHKYPGFLRRGSILGLIIISDAPEQSDMDTPQFLQELAKIKGDTNSILFYGFLNPVDWCIPTDDTWNWAGSKFEQATTALHGKVYKLCDPQFSDNLVNLGNDLAQRVTRPRFYLAERPVTSTLKVVYKTHEILGGAPEKGGFWEYDYEQNAIIFSDLSFAPGDTESIQVVYTVDNGYR